MHGPRAIRYARGEEQPALAALGCSGQLYDFIQPKADADVVLVSYGAESEETLKAVSLLEEQGIRADCSKLVQIFPLPEGLCEDLSRYKTILFAEEAVPSGGIGQQLCTGLHEFGWKGTFLHRGVDNTRLLHATVPQLREALGLDAPALASMVLESRKGSVE